MAIMPDENTRQSSAPSRSAMRRWAMTSVGFPYLPYSKRSFFSFVYSLMSLEFLKV